MPKSSSTWGSEERQTGIADTGKVGIEDPVKEAVEVRDPICHWRQKAES